MIANDPETFHLDTKFCKNGVIHRKSTGEEERWTQVKKLGEGGHGFVYLQKEVATAELRAVKKIQVDDFESNGLDIKRELCHLIALMDRQDLFIQFRGWYENGDGDLLYLVMEYFEHGDLGQHIKIFGRQEEETSREITRQLLEGLVVLHQKQICHRDLKPQNILIACRSPIRVKIADFGISKSMIGTNLRTQCGTQGYIAPELQGFRPSNYLSGNDYTNAVDMWALGCLVHEVLTSEIPFLRSMVDENLSEISCLNPTSSLQQSWFDTDYYSKFCLGDIPFPIERLQHSQVSDKGVDFVKRLMVVHPNSRPSAEEARDDPWLSPKAFISPV